MELPQSLHIVSVETSQNSMNSLVTRDLDYGKDNFLSNIEFLDDKSFKPSSACVSSFQMESDHNPHKKLYGHKPNGVDEVLGNVGKKVKKKIDQAFF